MKPLTILQGDCRHTLATLPEESVDCVVTSPPYFGLRNYGHADQIGLEDTPAEFVAELVDVFREIRRVLKKDGTAWLNLGDSYAGSGRGVGGPTGDHSTLQGSTTYQDQAKQAGIRQQSRIGSKHGDPGHTHYKAPPKGSCLPAGFHETGRSRGGIGRAWVKPPGGFKSKDLLGIPWRVAFALQADGWYLRQDVIWAKPNPMPESITDRCTKAHEYIFILSKSARYHYDADAIAEPAIYGTSGERYHDYTAPGTKEHLCPPNGRRTKKRGEFNGKTNSLPGREAFRAITETRNKRDVWNVRDEAQLGRWLKENAPEVLARFLNESRNKGSVWTVPSQPYKGAHFATFPPDLIKPCILAGCKLGGVVLDPFGGSGTTGKVALELGRKAILCELNPEYVALIEERTTTTMGLAL